MKEVKIKRCGWLLKKLDAFILKHHKCKNYMSLYSTLHENGELTEVVHSCDICGKEVKSHAINFNRIDAEVQCAIENIKSNPQQKIKEQIKMNGDKFKHWLLTYLGKNMKFIKRMKITERYMKVSISVQVYFIGIWWTIGGENLRSPSVHAYHPIVHGRIKILQRQYGLEDSDIIYPKTKES